MTISKTHSQGWISVPVPPEFETRAKEMRMERDRQYGNIYGETDTDERWVGDLGEIVFNSWFKHEGVTGFQWVLDDAAGKPDFITALNIRIGVKAVKRKGPPIEYYTAQVTARHAKDPIDDHYFFMSYEIKERRMWLLGGIERELFLRDARYYSAGEWVHKNYQVRAGHEIFNIEITKLIRPKDWIAQVIPGFSMRNQLKY